VAPRASQCREFARKQRNLANTTRLKVNRVSRLVKAVACQSRIASYSNKVLDQLRKQLWNTIPATLCFRLLKAHYNVVLQRVELLAWLQTSVLKCRHLQPGVFGVFDRGSGSCSGPQIVTSNIVREQANEFSYCTNALQRPRVQWQSRYSHHWSDASAQSADCAYLLSRAAARGLRCF
jgi:hypothetical protein